MAGSDLRGVGKSSPIPVVSLLISSSENKENTLTSGLITNPGKCETKDTENVAKNVPFSAKLVQKPSLQCVGRALPQVQSRPFAEAPPLSNLQLPRSSSLDVDDMGLISLPSRARDVA